MQPYTDEQIARWQQTAREQEAARVRAASARWEAALVVAAQAAAILREQFGATQVVLFGSAAHGRRFGPDSDIDLAAEGIPVELFWRAAAAMDYVAPQFEINLIAFSEATPGLMADLQAEGIKL